MRITFRLGKAVRTCHNPGMHTHFASATLGAAAFLSVLVFGSFWRLACLHGMKANNGIIAGLSRAGLAQY